MADAIRTEGTEQLHALARDLREAADKELTKNVRRAIRENAKPLGQAVIRAGAEKMPRRGGMSALVANASPGVRFSGAKNPTVALLLKDRSGHDLKALDAGILRHPIYARGGDRKKWTWRVQNVPARAFSDAFEAQAPVVRRAVLDAMQTTLDDAARKVH